MVTPGGWSATVGDLARPSGGFAMVAIDQREALRGMIARGRGVTAGDRELSRFKVEVARVLSPYASGMLVDLPYGLGPIVEAGALHEGCRLIVAVDVLESVAGGPAKGSRFDEEVDVGSLREVGARALKLLVIWRAGDDREARSSMMTRFLDRCHSARLPGIIEVVVRPPRDGVAWDREAEAILAAGEVAGLSPDLYKTEVPLLGLGDDEGIRLRCREITDALPCPWVVLSSGVSIDAFPRAVQLACEGGAAGFLAGRAIWSDCVGDVDWAAALARVALPRLKHLAGIVDETVGGGYR
ncbi:MAG: aldolase [Acidimicrobiales bacterium]